MNSCVVDPTYQNIETWAKQVGGLRCHVDIDEKVRRWSADFSISHNHAQARLRHFQLYLPGDDQRSTGRGDMHT